MAQLQVRANLLASDYPIASPFVGRTVLVGALDQKGSLPGTLLEPAKDDTWVPEAYYMHNVVPSAYGYKSVAYDKVINPPVASVMFVRIIPVRDSSGDRGYLGITADARTYIVSTVSPLWQDITPAGAPNVDVTYAYVQGNTYVCYANWNIFTVSIASSALITAAISWPVGADSSLVTGITSSNNYLLAHDGVNVYWSAALNALDMVPSLITGAGSGVPTGTRGTIVAMYPLSSAFAVYSTENVVIVNYTGNSRYPWVFREANNSAGISGILEVSQGGDDGANYVWTSAGLHQITATGAKPFLPEITDFLAGRMYEDYDLNTNKLTQTYLTTALLVRVTFSTARYVLISYGEPSIGLMYIIVYDTSLRRFGKLRIPHVATFELSIAFNGLTSYRGVSGISFNDLTGYSYADMVSMSNTAAEAKHTMAFLQADGTIQLANFEYANYTADAILIMGKYQYSRSEILTLQNVICENVDIANTDFNTYAIMSTDGLSINDPVQLVAATAPSNNPQPVRQYSTRLTGLNTSILFRGAFHLCSLLLIFSKHGRR